MPELRRRCSETQTDACRLRVDWEGTALRDKLFVARLASDVLRSGETLRLDDSRVCADCSGDVATTSQKRALCSATQQAMTRKLFGTDGIRGLANQGSLTPELAFRVGAAIAYWTSHTLKRPPRVIIGKDTRLSGYLMET